jgi:hypothetical protein
MLIAMAIKSSALTSEAAVKTRLALIYSDTAALPDWAPALSNIPAFDLATSSRFGDLRLSDLADVDVIVLWFPGDAITAASAARTVLTLSQSRVVLISDINSGLLLEVLLGDGLLAHGTATLPAAAVIELIESAAARTQRLCPDSTRLLAHAAAEGAARVTTNQIVLMMALSGNLTRKQVAAQMRKRSRVTVDLTIRRLCKRLGWNPARVADHARSWLYAMGYGAFVQ